MAIVELALVARTQLELVGAVREGARVAATSPDPARAASAVRAAMPARIREAVRVTVSRPARVGGAATVEAEVRHHLVSPLLDRLVVPLSARATMRVER